MNIKIYTDDTTRENTFKSQTIKEELLREFESLKFDDPDFNKQYNKNDFKKWLKDQNIELSNTQSQTTKHKTQIKPKKFDAGFRILGELIK